MYARDGRVEVLLEEPLQNVHECRPGPSPKDITEHANGWQARVTTLTDPK